MTELEPEHLRKVFIGGLHPDTTDDTLRNYFCKYGEILDCIVMKDSQTKRSRGFGFVAFDKSTCVDQLQAERPHRLDGKDVDTKRVVPKDSVVQQGRGEREQKVNKVFLGGLREQITDDDIRQYFGQFGVVERVETFTDKETNKRKGFGFVTYQDFDSVDKVVLQAQTSPDGKLNLQGFKVEVKKAKSQDEMRRGGGGRGGGRGGYNNSGFGGDYNNQGGGGGYNNQQGFGGGYNSGGGGYNQGYNQQGGGYGGGGDSSYQGGYNNGQNGSNWGNNQQGGGWGGNQGYQQQNQGGMGGGYNQQSSNQYGATAGGGPMRGGFNKPRAGPYSSGGGGGSGGGSSGGGAGWRN